MPALKDKVVLVTGGARRLGKHIALAAAREGAHVAITYRTSLNEAQGLRRDLEALGDRALALHCDVADEHSVREAVGRVLAEWDGIDILVNNAANFESVPFEELTVEQWDRMFASNARGPFLVTRICAHHLRHRHGRVINMGSLGGLHPWATHAHYCASKAALEMLNKVMAKALAPEIAVNCVAPGTIELGEGEEGREGFFRSIAQKTPMQRNGSADDVIAAVMFFATAPHFITGQTLVVDGGLGLV